MYIRETKVKPNLQDYYEELSGLAKFYGLPVEGAKEAMQKAEQLLTEIKDKKSSQQNKKTQQQKLDKKLRYLDALLPKNSH